MDKNNNLQINCKESVQTIQANSNISNKELILFFFMNFGCAILLGVLMFYEKSKNYEVTNLATIQMLLPAAAVMIIFLRNKDKRDVVAGGLYKIFLFFAFVYSFTEIFSLIVFGKYLSIASGVLIIGSCLIMFICFIGSHDHPLEYSYSGLTFKTGFTKTVFYIMLFIVLLFLRILIVYILAYAFGIHTDTGGQGIQVNQLILHLVTNIFGLMIFFGEEYGWRYFLQPALQSRLGAIRGIIVLGIIWETWHLALVFTLYSPETPMLAIALRLVNTTGLSIFFGYVFMKTKNVWIIAIFHYLNNSLAYGLFGGVSSGVCDVSDCIISVVSTLIVFFPFLYLIKKIDQSSKVRGNHEKKEEDSGIDRE